MVAERERNIVVERYVGREINIGVEGDKYDGREREIW